jgi:hypothetical protein
MTHNDLIGSSTYRISNMGNSLSLPVISNKKNEPGYSRQTYHIQGLPQMRASTLSNMQIDLGIKGLVSNVQNVNRTPS